VIFEFWRHVIHSNRNYSYNAAHETRDSIDRCCNLAKQRTTCNNINVTFLHLLYLLFLLMIAKNWNAFRIRHVLFSATIVFFEI